MPPLLVALLLFVVAGVAAALPDDASACSCAAGIDPRVVLRDADAAFVGTVAERRAHEGDRDRAVRSSGDPVTLLFRVEESVKADLGAFVEVETVSSGVSCGIEARVGKRLGLFLYAGRGGGWTSSHCSRIEPAVLLEAAGLDPSLDDGSGHRAVRGFYSALAGLFGFLRPLCPLDLFASSR
ncbi:MAG: hypothetical protein ACRDNE_02330 [Gaiellaceae bacterium]